VDGCDFILIVGGRIDPIVANWREFAPNAVKAVVDIDEAEVYKLSPDIHFCLDSAYFFREMMKLEWRKPPAPVPPKPLRGPAPNTVYAFVEEMRKRVSPDDIIVPPCAGNVQELWYLYAANGGFPIRMYGNWTLGSMGYSLPYAVGLAVATGKKTWAIEGDGSMALNAHCLETIAQYDLPVEVYVLENEGYQSIRQSQLKHFGEAEERMMLPYYDKWNFVHYVEVDPNENKYAQN
jgi:acetolactate synthase-1/2/3 large subunit